MATSSSYKPKEFQSTAYLRELMATYYSELAEASESPNDRVAWCSSVGPAELLIALGFKVYYPENHGAVLGAKRLAMDYIPVANAYGYSPEICSYLTSDIGAFIRGETPLTKMYGIKSVPKPDVLVYNTNQCREIQDWFAFYARHYNVPLLGINSPRTIPLDLTDTHIRAVEHQLKELVAKLEPIAGTKLDLEQLQEVVRISLETTKLWKRVLESGRNKPSPLTFFDSCIHMAPAVLFRGTERAIDYYRKLIVELEERINKNIGAIENERFRLYWEGMPIWGKLRDLAELFAGVNTCIVASTYCNSWVFESFDPADPFYSLAKGYAEIFVNRAEDYKEHYIEHMIELYHIDGIIFHEARTCQSNTNSKFGMHRRLYDRLGIPSLVIAGDLNDLRCYSHDHTRTAVEAFIEQLGSKK